MAEPAGRDRAFGPTVLVGLLAGVLAAVAGTREWATATGEAGGIPVTGSVTGSDSQPLVPALALVALAAWGALLVLRGNARRLVAVVGLLAAAGAVVAVSVGFDDVPGDAVRAAMAHGGSRGDAFTTDRSTWYFLAGLGSLATAVALAVAAVRAPRWPAMGSRYDAPSARRTTAGDGERPGDEAEAAATRPQSDADIWKALDEGRDPTS